MCNDSAPYGFVSFCSKKIPPCETNLNKKAILNRKEVELKWKILVGLFQNQLFHRFYEDIVEVGRCKKIQGEM